MFRKTRYISLKNESEATIQNNNFLNESDLDVLHRFKSFQNNPNSLIKIVAPTLLSMLVCPMTLFVYKPLLDFTWPPNRFPTPPDINSAVNCFLMPAGLVYAIFQNVMSNFQQLSNQITEQISMFSQVVKMTNAVRSFSKEQRKQICLCIKDEIMRWIEIIIGENKITSSRRNGKSFFNISEIWL